MVEDSYSFINEDGTEETRLAGAALTLRGRFMRADGTIYEGELEVLSGNSSSVLAGYSLIPSETYELVNTVSPPGYAHFARTLFMLGQNGELVLVSSPDDNVRISEDGRTFVVSELPTTISVEKRDLSGKTIAGTEATISVSPTGDATFVNTDKPKATITATASGLTEALQTHLCVSMLLDDGGELRSTVSADASVYELRETKAPAGYEATSATIYFALDQRGHVHLLRREGSGYVIAEDAYGTTVTKTADGTITVLDPATAVELRQVVVDTKKTVMKYRIDGVFSDGTTTQTIVLAPDVPVTLEGLIVADNVYTITERVVVSGVEKDGDTVRFAIDPYGGVRFMGDALGSTSKRELNEALGRVVSVITLTVTDDHVTPTPSTTDGDDEVRPGTVIGTTTPNSLEVPIGNWYVPQPSYRYYYYDGDRERSVPTTQTQGTAGTQPIAERLPGYAMLLTTNGTPQVSAVQPTATTVGGSVPAGEVGAQATSPTTIVSGAGGWASPPGLDSARPASPSTIWSWQRSPWRSARAA